MRPHIWPRLGARNVPLHLGLDQGHDHAAVVGDDLPSCIDDRPQITEPRLVGRIKEVVTIEPNFLLLDVDGVGSELTSVAVQGIVFDGHLPAPCDQFVCPQLDGRGWRAQNIGVLGHNLCGLKPRVSCRLRRRDRAFARLLDGRGRYGELLIHIVRPRLHGALALIGGIVCLLFGNFAEDGGVGLGQVDAIDWHLGAHRRRKHVLFGNVRPVAPRRPILIEQLRRIGKPIGPEEAELFGERHFHGVVKGVLPAKEVDKFSESHRVQRVGGGPIVQDPLILPFPRHHGHQRKAHRRALSVVGPEVRQLRLREHIAHAMRIDREVAIIHVVDKRQL